MKEESVYTLIDTAVQKAIEDVDQNTDHFPTAHQVYNMKMKSLQK